MELTGKRQLSITQQQAWDALSELNPTHSYTLGFDGKAARRALARVRRR
jgi:hypothetical protein